ncbi:unnamed protein product [Rotaria sordida]|uniref:Uncharacterized protein n=1 Tax=Rotaria sordida TaxID=392033 RepID=A0A819RCZ7_9BILA|nr:unnamed protein product [Rotaria sordida]
MNICQQKSSKILGIAIILGAIAFFIRLRTQEQLVGFQSKPLQVWYTAEQRFKRPFYINRDHGFCGPCPEDKQLSYAWRLVDIVAHISPKFPFIVNIGAASIEGGRYDPTYSLLSTTNLSFGALLIDPITHPSFFNAYPNRSDQESNPSPTFTATETRTTLSETSNLFTIFDSTNDGATHTHSIYDSCISTSTTALSSVSSLSISTIPSLSSVSSLPKSTVPALSTVSSPTRSTISSISSISSPSAQTVPSLSTVSSLQKSTVPALLTVSSPTTSTISSISSAPAPTVSSLSTASSPTMSTISPLSTTSTMPSLSITSTILSLSSPSSL